MVFISFYINFCCIHLWEISMTNKLFMVIIIVLVIMVGYMSILGNNYNPNVDHNIQKPTGVFYIDNGKTLTEIGSMPYNISNSNNTLQNTVSPDLTGNSTGTLWIVALGIYYPITWFPYFTTISNAGITPYNLHFRVYSNNGYVNGSLPIQYDGLTASQGSIYAYSDRIFIVLPAPEFNDTSIVTIGLNINNIYNSTTNNSISVNNLSSSNNPITFSLYGLPLGNYQQDTGSTAGINGTFQYEAVNVSTTRTIPINYNINNYYNVTFKGEPNFNVTLVNPNPNQASIIYGSDNGYVNITLKNGTYNYLIFNGYTNFSGSFTISGNNTIVFISPTAFFVHSPLFDFYVYLFIVFSFLITILHFTRGSMVFLSFSSLIFLYIGYKLDIALFTINAILLMVLIFSAMISYKVFLE